MAKLSDPVPGSYRLWSREAQMARRHISHATYGHERSPPGRSAGPSDSDTEVRRRGEHQPRPRSPVY